MCLALLTCTRDFHPLDCAHAGHTSRKTGKFIAIYEFTGHIQFLAVIFFTALGWFMHKPSSSQRNCCRLKSSTSSGVSGHWNLPFSSRLYKRTKPSPSNNNALSRSCFLLLNKNKLLSNGPILNFCCTKQQTRSFHKPENKY